MAAMSAEDIAAERGRRWGAAVAKRRTGEPLSWPPFSGSAEHARRSLLDLVERPSPYLEKLVGLCMEAARASFESARRQAGPLSILREREERRRRRALRG